MSQKTGIQLIADERSEQLTKHGRTVELDVEQNNEGQLTDAASVLTMNVPEGLMGAYLQSQGEAPPIGWDSEIWNKMIRKPYKDRLIIAGALIAAEIDRLQNEPQTNG
jgi:hypothetical protein